MTRENITYYLLGRFNLYEPKENGEKRRTKMLTGEKRKINTAIHDLRFAAECVTSASLQNHKALFSTKGVGPRIILGLLLVSVLPARLFYV
jgi:hypothetical protein